MTQSFEKCIHGVPVRIECSVCKRNEEIKALPKDHPQCVHGRPEGYCYECKDIESQKEREKLQAEKESQRIDYIRNNSGSILINCSVPKKYLECSLDTFRGNDKLIKECKKYIPKGGGLVLAGNTGSGKTHLAISLLREMVKEDKVPREGDSAQFITVPDLLLEIRSSFKDNPKNTEDEIIKFYSTMPVLIIDDLGSEKTTEFAVTTLYIIIDRRDREMLTTIITTNLTLKEIEEKLDARIASRLAGMKTIKINMSDYRKLKH